MLEAEDCSPRANKRVPLFPCQVVDAREDNEKITSTFLLLTKPQNRLYDGYRQRKANFDMIPAEAQ
jgi:hypothetical protein